MFASILQFFKLLILGHTPQGIRARTILAVCTTIAVLIIEVAAYSYYWDEIPDMIRFDYDFNGVPNDIVEKNTSGTTSCSRFLSVSLFFIFHLRLRITMS